MIYFPLIIVDPTNTCPADIEEEISCVTAELDVDFAVTGFDQCATSSVVYSSQGATVFERQTQSSSTMNVGTSDITATATVCDDTQISCTYSVIVNQGMFIQRYVVLLVFGSIVLSEIKEEPNIVTVT